MPGDRLGRSRFGTAGSMTQLDLSHGARAPEIDMATGWPPPARAVHIRSSVREIRLVKPPSADDLRRSGTGNQHPRLVLNDRRYCDSLPGA